MPVFDVSEVHDVSVSADPGAVWNALQEVTLDDVPLFRMLMAARELPGRLVGRRWLTGDVDRTLLDQMMAVGFVPLERHESADVALGLLTRPWRPGGGAAPSLDAESFLAFDEPGWAKAVLGFTVTGVAAGTVLRTETRVQTTDAAARRRFRAYWAVVGRGSAATRRSWLAAVKRWAEQGGSGALRRARIDRRPSMITPPGGPTPLHRALAHATFGRGRRTRRWCTSRS